jgi:hypothetical protein
MDAYSQLETAEEEDEEEEEKEGADNRLGGCRVLLIEHPHVFRVGNLYGVEEERITVRPAAAILEDPAATRELKEH